MAVRLMYISNDDTQNYPYCRLQLLLKRLGLNAQINQNLLIVPKVFNSTNKKTLLKIALPVAKLAMTRFRNSQ